ncbi:hypothetical protein ACIRF8_12595 [Streptomyces sp. NPDC102406]|uniref:hypothetical protein n=1 Tax=Streptomyces sp. NPDC102406 TaxID=3366171 RepID=UPI00382F7FFD
MTHRIEGPFPLTLKATANGAELGLRTWLVRSLFLELFEDADADQESFAAEFADMHALSQAAQRHGADSHERHEFDERMNQMIDKYADGGTVEVYTTGVGQLLAAAREIAAVRPVRAQREAGAA